LLNAHDQQDTESAERYKVPSSATLSARWGSQTPRGGKDHPGGLITRRAETGDDLGRGFKRESNSLKILPSLFILLPQLHLAYHLLQFILFPSDGKAYFIKEANYF
jgi:hypothetical protein